MLGKNLKQYLQRQLDQDPTLATRLARMRVYFDIAFHMGSLRRRRGLTQKELAEKLNTTQPNIARWETPGYERYSISRLIDLAEALDAVLEIRFVERATQISRVEWSDNPGILRTIRDYNATQPGSPATVQHQSFQAPRYHHFETIMK